MTLLLLPFCSSARPQRTPTAALPTPLRQVLPSCAQSCVSTIFASYFPTLACLKPDELDSFCCQYSSVAFALEQLILSCIKENCSLSPNNDSVSVQSICGQSSSITESAKSPASITTSTLSAKSSVRTAQTVPIENTTTRVALTTVVSSSAFPAQSASTSKTVLLSDTTERATIVSTQTAPVASSIAEKEDNEMEDEGDNNDPGPLTTGQIIGISMSAVGTLAFALGAISIITYFRRRRLQRRVSEGEAFGFQSSSRPSLDLHTTLDKPKLAEAVQKPEPVADLTQPVVLSRLNDMRNRSTTSMRLDSIGVAISSEARTDKSLPERPTQKPRKPIPVSRVSSTSETTVFEEDRRSAFDKKPNKITTMQDLESATSDQTVGTPPFCYEDQLSGQQEKPPVPPKPSLSVQIPEPKSGPDPRFVQPYTRNQQNRDDACSPKLVTASRLVAMLAARPPIDKTPSYNESSNRSSFEYIPRYYTTPRDQIGGLEDSWEYNPSAGRRLDPSSHSSSFVKRDSRASDTSFETTVPDEETPPANESKKLSPVVESPISGLRYPKVPRASNQLVVRQSASLRESSDDEASKSPDRTPLSARRHRRNQSNQSSDKSATKNISGHKARPSNSKTPISLCSDEGWQILGPKDETAMVAPLKLHGRYERAPKQNPETKQVTTSADIPGEEINLKSPLWDPRLYPLRRGDELFLYLK